MDRHSLIGFGLAAMAGASFAQTFGDEFASSDSFQAPSECGPAYAACMTAQRLESVKNERMRTAGMKCRAPLNSAVSKEDALNSHIEHMRTLTGDARTSFYKNTVQPTNSSRVRMLDAYRDCTLEAMQDLRPPDYPRSEKLLHGGVSTDPPRPGDAPWKANVRDTLRRIDNAFDPVATPVQNLSNVLNAIAPHYDMAGRNDTGLRVIKDILIDMGLGHLAGKAGGALRGMASKTDDAAKAVSKGSKNTARAGGQTEGKLGGGSGNPAPQPGKGRPVHYGSAGWNLPAGMKLPPWLAKTRRPVYLQEEQYSCVQACVRMVGDTINRMPMREGFLRNTVKGAYEKGTGTWEGMIEDILTKVRIPNKGWYRASVDELAKNVNDGYPAIISYGKEHASVLDAVVEHGGERWLFIRNPANPAHLDDMSREMVERMGKSNYEVIRENDFLGSYMSGGGMAIFTNP